MMRLISRTPKSPIARPATAGLAAAVLLALTLPGPAAVAANGLHGTICKPKYGSQDDDIGFYSGGIRNNGSPARWVSCPIDRHESWSNSGMTSAFVYLYNYNVVGYDNTRCYFRAKSASGSTYYTDVAEVTATGNATLFLQVPPSGFAYYHIECRLSPYTYLRAIYVAE